MSNELQSKINTRLEDAHMRSSKYFTALNSLKMFFVFLSVIFVCFLVSQYIWDLYYKYSLLMEYSDKIAVFSGQEFDRVDMLIQVIKNTLFENLFLTVLLTFGGFLVYRSTDWPMVKNTRLIMLIVTVLLVVLCSGVSVVGARNQEFKDRINTFNNKQMPTPFRDSRYNNIEKKRKELNQRFPNAEIKVELKGVKMLELQVR